MTLHDLDDLMRCADELAHLRFCVAALIAADLIDSPAYVHLVEMAESRLHTLHTGDLA